MFEQLGFCPEDKLLLINADDLGITRSSNKAILELFHRNCITSASIMIPCLAAYEAAMLCNQNKSLNIGIHLTLTSSENYLYKPVYQKEKLHSLITKDGFFPIHASEVEQNADPEEVRIELETQISTALSWGINPTHLDSHAGSIMGLFHGRDFLEIVFDLCEKYELPFNLPLSTLEQPFFSTSQKELFARRIESAKRRGILSIDDLKSLHYYLLPGEEYEDMKKELMEIIKMLKPGTTQIVTHPSIVTEELRALTPHFMKREMEYRLFSDPEIKRLIDQENIKMISWKVIWELQRIQYRL